MVTLSQRLLAGFTAFAFLSTSFLPLAPAYAMKKSMEKDAQPFSPKKPIEFRQPLVSGESTGQTFELFLNMTKDLAKRINEETGLEIEVKFEANKKKIANNYKIGEGYFGGLYFARTQKNKAFVGVKLLQDSKKSGTIEMALKEVQIQNKLNGTPHLMPLLDHYHYISGGNYHDDIFAENTLLLFMPLDTFGNGEFFQKQVALLTDDALRKKLMEHVAVSVLKGITFMQEKGFAHLDLHPGNITMDRRTGAVHLIDFGCAKAIGANNKVLLEANSQGIEDAIGHNKIYATPERLAKRRFEKIKRGEDFGDAEVLPTLVASTDHYALAISLYEICFNDYPLPEDVSFTEQLKCWDYAFFKEVRKNLPALAVYTTSYGRNRINMSSIEAFLWLLLEPDYKKRLKPREALARYPFQELSEEEGHAGFDLLSQLGKAPLPPKEVKEPSESEHLNAAETAEVKSQQQAPSPEVKAQQGGVASPKGKVPQHGASATPANFGSKATPGRNKAAPEERREAVPLNASPQVPAAAKKAPLSMEALQLEKGDSLLAKEKYDEAMALYKKFSEKGVKEAQDKLDHAFSVLIKKGDGFYVEENFGEALGFYGQAAGYGSKDAQDRVLAIGVEAGDAYVAQGKASEALKYYEQAVLHGSEEAKEKLKKLKQAEVARQKAEQQKAEAARQREEQRKVEQQRAEQRERQAEEQRKQKAAEEASRQAEAETRRLEAERVRLAAVPAVARDHVDIYERFLKGILVYRPDPKSDVGKIEISIAALANPLEGTFDLSRCGDAGKYLSIATGYRKGKIAANASKLEIWITPRFLIEKNLSGNAKHFTDIMGKWDATKAPLGAFYTWGGWDDLGWYDYATTQDFDAFSKEDFYGKWHPSGLSSRPVLPSAHLAPQLWKKFHVDFYH